MLFSNGFKHISHIPHFYIIRTVESRLLADYIGQTAGPYLDLGCGDGKFGSTLGLEGFYGIDIDEKALTKVSASSCYKKALYASASAIPFSDSFFATVFSNCAIEHMDGLDTVLKEVRRVLAHGGKFILTVPSARFLQVIKEDKILREVGLNSDAAIGEYNRIHHHVNIFDFAEWQKLLEKAGFKILEHEYYLPASIGSFVMRMDMLYTVEAPGSKEILGRLEKKYGSWAGLLFRKKVERYLKNPHGRSNGTHLIIKAERE